MLFNSLSFLIFFPTVAIAYFILPYRFRWTLLLAASCYFYMAFVPAYILILFYLIAIDFTAGILIERSTGPKKKAWLQLSIFANVGTLFFFKYFNFFNANVAKIAILLHWSYSPFALSILLPLGLSFHTFQSLAYVIEVYRGRFKAERHLGIYALYVMFFPQLVAGPIERPQELLPQLHAHHDFNEPGVVQGLEIMLWGFFKKMVVADTIGIVVDTVYGNNLRSATGPLIALAAIAFMIQLYADFSGYSDIARGAAKVFGINLLNNFNTPFQSRSIAEFWRRWHISLSSWFRDYFYQPLALVWTRISKVGLYAALFVTFVILGLWHGAGWTYVVFGAIFGIYMVFALATKKYRDRIASAIGLKKFPAIYGAWQTAATLALVCVALIFFRISSITDAAYAVLHLGSGWNTLALATAMPGLSSLHTAMVIAATLLMVFGEELNQRYHLAARFANNRSIRWAAYYFLLIWIIVFVHYTQRTFIYFQF